MKNRLKRALIAIVPLAAIGAGALHVTESRARARTQDQMAELTRWRLEQDFSRDALWGETEEGQAWPHFLQALDRVDPGQAGRKRRQLEFAAAVEVGKQAGAAGRAELLDEFSGALEHLRRGAHARDGRVTIDPRAGFHTDFPRLTAARQLSQLTLMRLLEASTPEDQVEAVRCVLDGQAFARDLTDSSLLITTMIGSALILPSGLEEHLEGGLMDRLDEAAKREWLAGLGRLEASLPTRKIALRGELELFAYGISGAVVPLWSSGSSPIEHSVERFTKGLRLQHHAAEFVADFAALAPQFDELSDMPPQAAQQWLEDLQRETESSWNPVAHTFAPHFASIHASAQRARASLSFLRYALALHLGEADDGPLDAFGTGVEVERADGRIRVSTTTFLGQTLEITL